MTAFNTIQYCIDNSIPCFTFKMDASKELKGVKWGQINTENFRDYIVEFFIANVHACSVVSARMMVILENIDG